MKLLFKTPIQRPVSEIKEGFTKDLFLFLSPPFIPFELERFDGCEAGNEVHIRLGPKALSQKWVSLITSEGTTADGWSFVDEGRRLPWPLSYWRHHHRVDRVTETSSEIVDDIEYRCRPGFLTPLMRPFLWASFSIRPRRYQAFFKDIA
jgi:ligand-binding SRPBCC domain-containing protein